MKQLENKVAIITGASKGIGEAIAKLYATNGAQVVICSRKPQDLEEVKKEIEQEGGSCLAWPCHVGDEQQLQLLVEQTLKTFGGVDILVNNAATNPIYGPVLNCNKDSFDKIMQVNVYAPLALSKLVYELMKNRGGGSIINISSIAGSRPDPGLGMYSVSKAALDMLTKVKAKEWGVDGIRVNAIAPGLIKTKFSQALWENEKMLNYFIKNIPIARMGKVEEIAAMALYLASDAAKYTTGQILAVDGGTLI